MPEAPLPIDDLIATDTWKSATEEERQVATQRYRKQAFDYLSSLEGSSDVFFEAEDAIAEKLSPGYKNQSLLDMFKTGVEQVSDIPELAQINSIKRKIETENEVQGYYRPIVDMLNEGERPQGYSDQDIARAGNATRNSEAKTMAYQVQLTEKLEGFANNQILRDKKEAEKGTSRAQQLWQALPDGDASVIKDFLLSPDGVRFIYESSVKNSPQAVMQIGASLINPLGGGAAGGMSEYYSGIVDRAGQEVALRGLDPEDPNSLLSVMSDEDFMKKASEAAGKKAGVIAAVDALSFKIGGTIARKLANGTIKGVAGSAATGQLLDVASGGLGEGLGQVAAGDELSKKGIAEESFALGPQTITESVTALGQTAEIRSQYKADDATARAAVANAGADQLATFDGAKVTVFGGANDPADSGINDKGQKTGAGGREGVSIPKRVQLRLFGNDFKNNRENYAVSILDKDGNEQLFDIVDHGPAERVIKREGRMVLDVTPGVAKTLGVDIITDENGKMTGNSDLDLNFSIVPKRKPRTGEAGSLTETASEDVTQLTENADDVAPPNLQGDQTAPIQQQEYITPSGEINKPLVEAKGLLDTFKSIQAAALESSDGVKAQRNAKKFKENVGAAQAIFDRAKKGDNVSNDIKELRKKANASTLVKSKRVEKFESRVEKQLKELTDFIDSEKKKSDKLAADKERLTPRPPQDSIDHAINSELKAIVSRQAITIDTDLDAEIERWETVSQDPRADIDLQEEALDRLSDLLILSAAAPGRLESILAGSDQSTKAKDLASKQGEALSRYSDARRARQEAGLGFGGRVTPQLLDPAESIGVIEDNLASASARGPLKSKKENLSSIGGLVTSRKDVENRTDIANRNDAYKVLGDEFVQLTESLRNMMGTDRPPSKSEVKEVEAAFREAFEDHLPDWNNEATFLASINATLPAFAPAKLPSLTSIRAGIEASVKPPKSILNRLANAVLDFLRKIARGVFRSGEQGSVVNPFKIKRNNAKVLNKNSQPWLKFQSIVNNRYALDFSNPEDVLSRAKTDTGFAASVPFRLVDKAGGGFAIKILDGRVSANKDDHVFIGGIAYTQIVDEVLSKSNIMNARLDRSRKDGYSAMGYSSTTGLFESLRVKNPDISLAPSDVFESYLADPESIQLTEKQKEFLDSRIDAVREITNIALAKGLNIDPKNGKVKFDGSLPYFPRGVAADPNSRGLNVKAALGAARNKKRSKAKKKGFQEDRQFETEMDGIDSGFVYKDPDSRILDYYKDMGRQYAERNFLLLSSANGMTHADIESSVKSSVSDQINSGSLDPSLRNEAITAGIQSMIGSLSRQDGQNGDSIYIPNSQAARMVNSFRAMTEPNKMKELTTTIKTISSLSFSFDVGFLGIQVTTAAGISPTKWIKAIQTTVKSLGSKEVALKMIDSDPRLSAAMENLVDGGYSIGEFIDEAAVNEGRSILFPNAAKDNALVSGVKTVKRKLRADRLDSAFANTMDILAAMNAADQIDRDNLKGVDTSTASYKKQLADGISRMGGRGIGSNKTNPGGAGLTGAILFFATRYYRAAVESIALAASSTNPVERSLALRTLGNFGLFAGLLTASLLRLAGVEDEDEWIERLLDFRSKKWLRVPFRGEDGLIREVSYGHVLKPTIQLMSSLLPSSDKSVSDSLVQFLSNRKSVPLATVFDLYGPSDYETIGTRNPPHIAWVLASKILPIPVRNIIESSDDLQYVFGRQLSDIKRDDATSKPYSEAALSFFGLNQSVPSLSGQIIENANRLAKEQFGTDYSKLPSVKRVAVSYKSMAAMEEKLGKQKFNGYGEEYISDQLKDYDRKEKEFLDLELQLTEKLFFSRAPEVYDLGFTTKTGKPEATKHYLTDEELKRAKSLYVSSIKSYAKRVNYKVPEGFTVDDVKKVLIKKATEDTIRALGYKPKP